MKVATVNEIVGILAGIKICKIADKQIKSTLINDYLHLRKFVKESEEDRQEIIRKFQDDWRDELTAVEALRQEGKPVSGHDAYLEAERDANKAIADLFSREVEVPLKPVSTDAFLSAIPGEELTLEQLAFLEDSGLLS